MVNFSARTKSLNQAFAGVIALTAFLVPAALVLAQGKAQSAPTHSIKVTLFGQPCNLTGPFSGSTLQKIHQVSPAEIPRIISSKMADSAADRISKTEGLPKELKEYTQNFAQYIASWQAFFSGLQDANKKRDKQLFLQKISAYSNKGAQKQLGKMVDQFTKGKGDPSENLQKLVDLYREVIPPRPEEIFHRSIKQIHVRYDCTFEGSE